MRLAASFPLDAGVKPAAAPPAQARFFYFADHTFRSHFRKRFGQRGITANSQIIIEPGWVNHAVLAEDQTVLFLIEGDIFFFQYRFFCVRIAIEQFFQDFPLGDGFGNYFRHVFYFDLLIKYFFRVNHHQRAFFAKTETAGGAHFHVHILFFDFRFQLFFNGNAAVAAAARAGADGHKFFGRVVIFP